MAYTITSTAPNMTVVTANSVWMFTVKDSAANGGAVYIQGEYTKGDETATAFSVSTRRTADGDDTPVYVRGTDNSMTQLAPKYTATGRFEILVPLLNVDKYVVITADATGSATGTIAYDYASIVR